MMMKQPLVLLVPLFLGSAGLLWAEEQEISIDIISTQEGGPSQIINKIELPEAPSATATERSALGLETVDQFKENYEILGNDSWYGIEELDELENELEELDSLDQQQIRSELEEVTSQL